MFSLPEDKPELLLAQAKAFSRQTPLLYFIFLANAAALSYTISVPRRTFSPCICPPSSALLAWPGYTAGVRPPWFAMVRQRGGHVMQGYYFAKPMRPDEFDAYLTGEKSP